MIHKNTTQSQLLVRTERLFFLLLQLLIMMMMFSPAKHVPIVAAAAAAAAAAAPINPNGNVFSIYSLPPFAMTLTSTWTIVNEDIVPTATLFKSITTSYLYDFFYASSLSSSSSSSVLWTNQNKTKLELHALELQVSAQMIDSHQIWIEVYGDVTFTSPTTVAGTITTTTTTTTTVPTPQQMQIVLEQWIAQAFDPETSLAIFQQRIITQAMENLVLIHLNTIQMAENVQDGPPSPTFPSNTNDSNTNTTPSATTWLLSTTEWALFGALIWFVIAMGTAIYIFRRMDRYKYCHGRQAPPHVAALESLWEQQQQQHNQNSISTPPHGTTSREGWYDEDAYYTGRPMKSPFIPIVDAQGRRRYVDTSMQPQQQQQQQHQDLIHYGASHLHWERHGIMKQQRSNQNHGYFRTIPLWIRSKVQSLLDGRKHPFSKKDRHEVFDQDLPLAFRESTRLGETPRLLDDPTEQRQLQQQHVEEEEQIDFDDSPDDDTNSCMDSNSFTFDMSAILEGLHPTEDITTNKKDANDHIALSNKSMHSNTSQKSISSTNSLEQFLARLEKLYQFKQKQYQQRIEMDRERRQRRLDKQQQKLLQQQQYQQQLNQSTPVRSNSVTTTMAMTTTSPLHQHPTTHIVSPTIMRTPLGPLRQASVGDGIAAVVSPEDHPPLKATSQAPMGLNQSDENLSKNNLIDLSRLGTGIV